MLDKATVREIAQNYTERVCKMLNPKTVILFGSYVNGNPHEFSDIDIAIVFNDYKGDWYETAVLLQRLRRGIDDDAPAGIEPHMMDETCDRSGFLEHVKKTGEVIYKAPSSIDEFPAILNTKGWKFSREEANERR